MDNDIIDISMDFDNLDNGSKSIFGKSKSNFGGGIELLMNEKRSTNSGGPTSDIDIEDLNNLENEINIFFYKLKFIYEKYKKTF